MPIKNKRDIMFDMVFPDAMSKVLNNISSSGTIDAIVINEAHLISSGPYTAGDLARMGHPFSAARPQDYPPREIINRGQGTFYGSFVVIAGSVSLRSGLPSLTFGLDNVDPKAGMLLHGTIKTVPRPWGDALRRRVRVVMRDFFRESAKHSLRSYMGGI